MVKLHWGKGATAAKLEPLELQPAYGDCNNSKQHCCCSEPSESEDITSQLDLWMPGAVTTAEFTAYRVSWE